MQFQKKKRLRIIKEIRATRNLRKERGVIKEAIGEYENFKLKITKKMKNYSIEK